MHARQLSYIFHVKLYVGPNLDSIQEIHDEVYNIQYIYVHSTQKNLVNFCDSPILQFHQLSNTDKIQRNLSHFLQTKM